MTEASEKLGRGPLPRVSVVGSGSANHTELARPLGYALARMGVHLVTGGGSGVMAQVARGFTAVDSREGLSIGILPGSKAGGSGPTEAPRGYPNPWVEVPILTHLEGLGERGRDPDSRNHLVVLTGQVVVALPGASGTLSEVELALEYSRPVIAHLAESRDFPGLPPGIPRASSLDDVLLFIRDRLESALGSLGS